MKSFFLKFSKKIIKFLPQITIGVIVIVIGFLAFFLYQNLYLSVIAPRPIDASKLTTSQEKVNQKSYDQITNNLNQKKETRLDEIEAQRNIFLPY